MSKPPPQRWLHERKGPLPKVRDAFSPLPERPTEPGPPPSCGPVSVETARLMLDEAQGVYAGRRDQALRAEARATTLQATAGIAIGLAFTGAAFLIDPAKVADRYWRIGLTVALGLTLFCLVVTAFLANRATTRLLSYWSVSPDDVCARGRLSEADAVRERALVLLTYADRNYYFSNFKIKHVKVAGLWFRAALASFAALSIGLMIYATLA